MFRRARLTVRPNVRPPGRAAATGSGGVDAEPSEPPGSDTPAADRVGTAAGSADARQAESDGKADNASDAGEASKPAEMLTQRRKRISTMPNLVKPRAGPLSAQRSAAKPQRRTSQASDGSASLQKDPSPSEKGNVESSLKSPMLPEKKTPVPQVPQFSPLKKSVNKEQTVGVAAPKSDDSLQKNVPSPLKERPTQERPRTQEEKLPSPEKVKRTCSDRERILKARKLREMLKEELKKERMKLKHRPPVIEGRSPPDRSKMTMRDLIYYLPENNPMKSSLVEEKRTERSSALSQTKEQEDKSTPDHDEEEEEEEDNGDESQDGPLLVPRVKVAEDGSIILDEESLTVEVLRTKGPCVVEENDPIFERGSTTTYSSFRKSFYTKPWSNKETDMFFLAISMVGTDFSLIGRLFPHRARAEIKNKFKREEKTNAWRIDKAFKEKRPFDFEFFAQLLEKVLADEEKRKQKNIKSQRPKEKKAPRPQKKSKAKAASTEAANDQDELQEAGISDAETEADGVTAEKENEESLDISEQAEEQVALEPALAKKKRKKKRKDDLEQEVENIPEEIPIPSKTAEEGKSSNKRKKVIHDASSDGPTTCGEEVDSAVEGKQNETAVTEEERSESCSPVNNQIEREDGVNLRSLEDSNDVILEEPAKLRTRDMRDDMSQESQIPELPVSNTRSKKTQSVENTESKNEDTHHSQKTDGEQSASDGGSQSEIMRTEKSADRRRLQRPKPNLVRSSGRREIATQDKMEAKTPPTLANAGEKCSEEDSRRNRNEATEAENRDLDTASQEPEKTALEKTIVRGCRQRFKPNVTRASGRKEEPEKDAGNDKISHLQPKGETEKNNDQGNISDVTSEDAAGKDDKILETVSQSSETAGLKEDGKQIVLNQAPLKRGRIQRPKPNLGRTVARQKEKTDEKDPEEETTEGEAEKGVIQHRDENNDPCLKSDLTVHEDTQLSSVTLEDVATDSEMNSIYTRECFQEKSSEAESYESEKGLSDVSKQVSDSTIGRESHPQKEEKKTVASSARLLRTRFQRPKPNLRTASRKEVLDVNSKGASQKDTNKEENLTPCDSEYSIPPDTDKAGKCEVLNALESLGKEKSLCSQEVSERPSCKSPKTLSRSEDGELEFCLTEISQDDISTPIAGDDKNSTQEEHQQVPLPPIQLAWNKRYKPNLVRTIGKKELQISENEGKKKPEAEQKDEFNNTVMGENEAVLCQADVLSKEEQEQQKVPQVLSISETILSEQSSTEKMTSQEGKLGAMEPGQFIRLESSRTRPNLERRCSEKGSPVAQKLAAPDEEMNQGENLSVGEESESPLSSKDDMEVLVVGNLAKNDNLDKKSMTSGMLCSPKESPNCNSKGEQEECLSTDAIGSIQDTTERSNDKLNSGEESEQRAREPHWNSSPDLVRLTRKRDYPEECENREEDSTERHEEEFLVLLKTGEPEQNSSNTVEAGSFSEATRKYNFVENVEEISCKRLRQDITLQSPGISSESQVEQDNDSQLSTSKEKHSDNLTRRQLRRSSKQTALPEHVLEPKAATSSASECEADCSEKGRKRQEAKLSVTRDKSLKTTQRRKSGKEPRSSKITFITLRASQEEEDEEPDDFELDDEEECFASEELNKAPVFVPIGLRSPKPISVQIQETMEELEIPVYIPDVQVATDAEHLSCASVQAVVQTEEKQSTSTAETAIHENPDVDKGINDGSTEAAMTLLAMGDPNFQLKTGTEEQAHMPPPQDDLDTADSRVIQAYSKESRTSSQYSLASDTSVKELLPSEDGNNINVEHQITGVRIGVEEYSEMDASDTSGSSLPVVNSMRLTGGGHLEPQPTSGISRSNENIMQEILTANVLVEQLEQIQTENLDPTTLRCSAEMQKVEAEPIRPAANDSSVLHDFAAGSMELTKQVDKTERTEKQIRGACGNSGDLRHLTASLQPEKSHLGLEDCPNPSSVDELSEQSPCPLEHHIGTVNFTQNEACNQDAQQHSVSSTEETSVVNDDHRCPEEEQTFILTLVEIPAGSKEFDASAMVEQTSEPVLPAPILISSINASETTVTEVESIGSLTTPAGEVAAPLNSSMETKQLESAVDSVPKLQTAQKRLPADLEENDFPPSKRTPSTVAVEDNLETSYKGYSIKSTDVSVVTSGNPLQKTESSAKEEVLTSEMVCISQLAERSQLETLESLGKALENPASKKEEEVMSRLTTNRKAEISGQEKQENVHESAQLEHTGNQASSSKAPLLRGGRKPLGFLSLICKKNNSESAEDTRGKGGKIQKPRIVTPKRSLKKPTPSTKDDRESCSFPSTSSSVEHEHVAADAAVMVPSNDSPEKPSLCAKDQEKEGEPTKISEYFFSDIFMEVDDSE